MRKLTLTALIVLTGCQQSTYQGIPSNAFPRHEFNFYFDEAMALDYTPLKANNWRIERQTTDGRYAYTMLTPKAQKDSQWTQALVVAYYPFIAFPGASTPSLALNELSVMHHYDCEEDTPPLVIEQTDNELVARHLFYHCDNDESQIIEIMRVIVSENGTHQVSYLQKNNLDISMQEKFTSAIKQAKLIGRMQQGENNDTAQGN